MSAKTQGDVRKLVGPAAAPPLDVVGATIRVPAPRPGSITRTALVNRLRAARSSRIVTVVAPAGYGKTTVLAQWAARDDRPFTWVTIDERDDDPAALLRHLAAALDATEPLPAPVLEALREPGGTVWAAALPRLTAVLESRSQLVFVLDDVSLLRSNESAQVMAALVASIPADSTMVLAGRAEPRAPLAGLRAEGKLFEVGTELLALSNREAELLVRATDAELEEGQLADLLERAEGWPAGLYLGTLALGAGGATRFGGDDRYLADYFHSACHDILDPARLAFLRRTSVLDEMSGPLCDAVLGRDKSAGELRSLESESLFLVPLDRRRVRYRYHPLFRDLLRLELAEHEAALMPELRSRAADWFEARGLPERAIEYAAAGGDMVRVARLICSLAPRAPVATVARWLELFDESELDRYPEVAAIGAWASASLGNSEQADRCLAIAERGNAGEAAPEGSVTARPLAALMRALLCRKGVDRMLVDVEAARAGLPPASPWLPTAVFLHGVAFLLRGDDVRADTVLAEAAERAEGFAATEVRAAAIIQRALIAGARDDRSAAEALAFEARSLASADSRGVTAALAGAAAARAFLRRSRFDEARAELAAVRRLEPLLTNAIPWLALEARIELARAHVTLRDVSAARELLAEAVQILRRRPGLGVLREQAAELGAEVEAMDGADGGSRPRLTGAELRLVPLLATHLSFREIGERLYVSRHTVKTQAMSAYRKLGVSSRSDAIAAAVRLGLVDLASMTLPPVASRPDTAGALRSTGS